MQKKTMEGKADNIHAVTGAFGYPGKYIAKRLLSEGKIRPIISVPPSVGYMVGWVIGQLVGDVMITREEIEGLIADLLYVDSPPAGNTKLTDWIREHASTLGLHYTSELSRRKDRQKRYGSN